MPEYIDREALTLLAYKSGDYGHPAVVDLEDIADIPAADVAPVVHGEWKPQEYWKRENKHEILYKTNRCSLCHFDVSSRLLYNYCPNCGANMKDGE